MKNFYWGGTGLLLLQGIRRLLNSRNNRSRTLFSFALPVSFLLFSNLTSAQELRRDSGADGPLAIKALTVGDSIPEEFWRHQLQAMNTAGEDYISLDRYRNKELIILDYWGIFCIPCIYAIDSLHTLSAKYGDRVQVVTVTLDSREKVRDMVDRRKWTLPGVVNDSVIRAYFPHRVVPHQIWIKDGKVLAIGSGEESNQENIDKVLAGTDLNIKTKKDRIDIDKQAPLMNYSDFTTEISQSTFSKYIDGQGAYKSTGKLDSMDILSYINMTPLYLYETALGLPSLSHISLIGLEGWDSRDTSKSISYQLITSIQDKSRIDSLVKKHLDDHFEVSSGYEILREKVWVIKQVSSPAATAEPIRLPISMVDLVFNLNNSAINARKFLFVSETAPKLKVSRACLEAFRSGDFDKFQQTMAEFGLKAVSEERDVEKFVIRKRREGL